MTSWVRFYRSDGTLVVEDDVRHSHDLAPGDRTQFQANFSRPDTRGWRYFLVSFVDRRDDTEIPCIGCDTRHVPPPPGPCGIPFDEGIAVTKQNSRGKWWGAGPVQRLLSSYDSEVRALDLVTSDQRNGFFLERIGTADYRGRSDIVRNVRLWRTGYILASYDDDLRDQLLNIRCLP